MNTWNSKKDCRSFYKTLCAQKFAHGLVQNQHQLDSRLRDFLSAQKGIWGAYRALPQEASVEVYAQVAHLTWVFPRMKEGALEFCEGRNFIQGPFGVWEPDPSAKVVPLAEVTGVLVPGLAFNKNGLRLGKGRGFYDKSLETFRGLKAGVAFDFQVAEKPLPTEVHDIKVDWLITESQQINCQQIG